MSIIRVLLVDDHAVLRDGLRSLLSLQEDIEVVAEAGDGQEAIVCAGQYRPDVVVMDIAMPRMNGLEATRQILARCPGTRVLVLSQHDDERYVLPCCQVGASGYLLKSAAADELVKAIRIIGAGGSFLPPQIAGSVLNAYRSLAGAQTQPDAPVLTEREREVLSLVAQGCTSKEIAERLIVSHKTVMSHRANIYEKLGIRNQAGLVRWAIEHGLVTVEG
jgi:DNA-binding NarL/FixJ family response regulator